VKTLVINTPLQGAAFKNHCPVILGSAYGTVSLSVLLFDNKENRNSI
jgi:hypothetical protein